MWAHDKLGLLLLNFGNNSLNFSLKAHLVKTTNNLVSVNLSDTVGLQVGMADNMRTNTPTHNHSV